MPYKLKSNTPEFNVVDGPMAGQKFRHGQVYDVVPEGDKSRFEGLKAVETPANQPPAKKNAVSDKPVGAKDFSPTKGGSK
ncbi:MAG: hypothetical protein B6240_14695 [Desulfobacteraceae bacterium 4572_87]|nr:MAG: hypothetical protein B6240_14695 [Desulfobacteraceae bacterium 4572_87]